MRRLLQGLSPPDAFRRNYVFPHNVFCFFFLPWLMVKDMNEGSTHRVFRQSCLVHNAV